MPAADEVAADKPVPRAPATLIYVPGLGHDTLNSADIIAKSIAARADAFRSDSVRAMEDTPAATAGMRAVRTLVDTDGTRLLDVTELDYREALEALDREDGREGVAPGLFVQAWYTVRGVMLWVVAMRRPGKSKMAKLQLALGLGGMLMLVAAFLITLVGFLAAALMQTRWDYLVPSWLVDSASWLALSGGLVSAAALARWRGALLRGGRRMRQLLQYFDQHGDREAITDALPDAIDKLRETGYDGDVHVLAYSFGSIVTLDTYVTGTQRPATTQGVGATTSIVTVGCPYDIISLYLPRHFRGQRPFRRELPWHNVFIPTDVLGSNFHPRSDSSDADTEVFHGWRVRNHVYLPQERLTLGRVVFRWIGLRRHNGYWRKTGGCWNEPLLRQWGLVKRSVGGDDNSDARAAAGTPSAVPQQPPAAKAVAGKTRGRRTSKQTAKKATPRKAAAKKT